MHVGSAATIDLFDNRRIGIDIAHVLRIDQCSRCRQHLFMQRAIESYWHGQIGIRIGRIGLLR